MSQSDMSSSNSFGLSSCNDYESYTKEYAHDLVVSVINMDNIVPKAGIKPTSPAVRASVLTIITHGLPDIMTILLFILNSIQ